MKVLVTGAAGFVGRRVCRELADNGHHVRGLVRNSIGTGITGVEILNGDVTDSVAASRATHGMDAVVHLAARAHVMNDHVADPLAEYRRVNVEGTRVMAHAAREAGVTCFVLASSVKAVGETSNGAWNSATAARPVDPYGVSKLEAEVLLREVSGAMSVTILRFPLVYGPGVRGNMLRLFQLIDKGWPIPVGNAPNARSLLFVGNAAAAIRRVLEVTVAADREMSGPFFLADGAALSTASLVHQIARTLGASGRMIPVPVRALSRLVGSGQGEAVGIFTRVGAIVNRLAGSLEVDEHEFSEAFDFAPPFTCEDGLAETARWFRSL